MMYVYGKNIKSSGDYYIYRLVVYTIHTYLQETVNFLHISQIDLAHLTHFKHMQCIT